MWKYKTPGIPDEEFERTEKVPITKEEVRVIQISKARLKPGQVVYDVGCGSGSISIDEMGKVLGFGNAEVKLLEELMDEIDENQDGEI